MFKFTVSHDYGIIPRLDIRRRHYNDHHNTNVGFPEWMKNTYNCTITYHYNSTVINTFNFNNQKDLNWFILQL